MDLLTLAQHVVAEFQRRTGGDLLWVHEIIWAPCGRTGVNHGAGRYTEIESGYFHFSGCAQYLRRVADGRDVVPAAA